MNELIIPECKAELRDGELVITNLDDLTKSVSELINKPIFSLIIENDSDKKLVKETRTDIRKRIEQLKNGRLSIQRKFMGNLEEQVKTIEKMLTSADNALKEKINDYEVKNGKVIIKKYDITIKNITKGDDVEKIKKIAEELRLEISVKEK